MKKLLLILLLLPTLSCWSQNLDIDILKDINLHRNKHLDNTFRGITNSAIPIAIGVPALLLGTSLISRDSLLRLKSAYIGVSVLSATAVCTILKYSFNRPRPFVTYPFLENITNGNDPSFPSGHTSDAFALATSLSLAYPKWYVIVPSYAWAGAVGYSRMDLGVHYPSDVLVGAIVGAGSAYLCFKALLLINKKRRRK